MNNFAITSALALCAATLAAWPATGQATFQVISYQNRLDQPAGMVEGSPGVFYSEAGSSTKAALSITTQGSQTTLTTFPSGYNLTSLLLSGPDNRFYSAVQYAANPANLFSVDSSPNSRQLYPAQNIVPVLSQNLPDSTFLGVGIANGSPWALVKADLKGTVTSIYQFGPNDHPEAPTYAIDGNYYGVSLATNAPTGYLYRVTPSGFLTTLYNFPSGTFQRGYFATPVLQASDGNLYGTTAYGGTNGTGTIYKMTLSGQYMLLASLPKDNNGGPTTLIEASDGNLYGATLGDLGKGGHSELFRVTNSGQFTVVYPMNITEDGACQCSLVQGSDGMLYGTATGGGKYGGGVYFALNASLPKPAPRALIFRPQSGPVGTKVLIWGFNLLSASVQFNGVAATTLSNSGSNYVSATVPTGATTGPITITTPGGSFTTKASFTVQ